MPRNFHTKKEMSKFANNAELGMRLSLATSLLNRDRDTPVGVVGMMRNIASDGARQAELEAKTRRLNALNRKLLLTNAAIKVKTKKLNEASRKIKILNKSLQSKVEERTRELQLAHEEILTL